MALFGSKKSSNASVSNVSGAGAAKDSPPANSKRIQQIQTKSSQDRCQPVDIPSEVFYFIYAHHFKAAFEYADDKTINKNIISLMHKLQDWMRA